MKTYDFDIQYRNDQFYFDTDRLHPQEALYLKDYLDKASRYKVIGWHQDSPVLSLYQTPLASLAGIRSLRHRLERRFEQKRIPATATLSITRACQCECQHCSAVYYNHSSRKTLTTDELKIAIDESVALGVTTLILLGGEPLLYPDLPKLIDHVPKEKASVILFTNGEFLSKGLCNRLKTVGLLGAFVSIDSPKEEEHNHLRNRKGLFLKAMQGIANLKQVGLTTGISSYLNPERLETGIFEQMMELGKDHGVQEITFFDAIPSGRWIRNRGGLLGENHREQIKAMVQSYRKEPSYPALSVQSTMTSKCGSAFCFAANTQFYLTAFGDFCPCDFTPLSIGEFPKQSLATLWNTLIQTEPYHKRAKSCRMQDEDFRKKYIDPIPLEGPFPYPLEKRA